MAPCRRAVAVQSVTWLPANLHMQLCVLALAMACLCCTDADTRSRPALTAPGGAWSSNHPSARTTACTGDQQSWPSAGMGSAVSGNSAVPIRVGRLAHGTGDSKATDIGATGSTGGTGYAGGTGSGSPTPSGLVQGCINKDFKLRAANWQDGTDGHSRLWLERVWEPRDASSSGMGTTRHADPGGSIDITVYTSLTISRLQQLEQQCLSWPGPLSAAVYIPVLSKRAGRIGKYRVGVTQAEAALQRAEPPSPALRSGYELQGAALQLPAPAQNAVKEAVATLDAFAARAASWGRCSLTLALYWELFAESVAAAYMFPINTLRNYAALMARTELVAMVDVDLVLSQGFVQSLLQNPQKVVEMQAEALMNHSMLVLPPFEAFPCQLSAGMPGATANRGGLGQSATATGGHDRSGSRGGGGTRSADEVEASDAGGTMLDGKQSGILAARGSKSDLLQLYHGNCVTIFHCARGTHWYNNYTHWFQQPSSAGAGSSSSKGSGGSQTAAVSGAGGSRSSGSVAAYEIAYGFLYEPWFIGHRALVPMYDVRFKGFGYNKQLQILQLVQQMKFRLMLMTDGWLVHLPHSYSAGSNAFHKVPHRSRKAKAGRAKLLEPAAGRKLGTGTGLRMLTAAEGLADALDVHRERPNMAVLGPQSFAQGDEALAAPEHSSGRTLQAHTGRLAGIQHQGTFAEQFKAHIELLFWDTQRNMGKDWSPELDASTQRCLKDLPWWQGYDEAAALRRLGAATSSGIGGREGAAAKGPPRPLPHISHDYFTRILRPQLFKCPKVED